jgi:type I restriction enzyme, S subunit
MKDVRRAIGIQDMSFELVTVKSLVEREVLYRPIDGNHGEIHPKTEDFVAEGVPFVMASDLKNGRIDYSGCAHITVKQAEGLRKGFAVNGDVLLTHKATIGETAIVEYDKHPYVMLTPQVSYYRVRNPAVLDNRYLRHYFDSSLLQQTLHMLASSGSTRAYLGITEQQRLPVILPPIAVQKKIAAVLSAYDDLIANNQRRIALLETMAEEIYREWFVRMRFPGRDSANMEHLLPVGWSRKPLGELSAMIKRGVSPDYSDAAEGIVLNQKCIREGKVSLAEARQHQTRVPDDKFVRYGDVLINSTGVGTLGRVAVFDIERSGITCDSHITILRPNAAAAQPEYLGHTVAKLQGYFESMAAGSTGQSELSRDLIAKTKVVVPVASVQSEFAARVMPMRQQRRALLMANDALARIRDSLLPRLISGKLKVDHLDIRMPPSMQAVALA